MTGWQTALIVSLAICAMGARRTDDLDAGKPRGMIAQRPGASCLLIVATLAASVMLVLLARRLWPWLFA